MNKKFKQWEQASSSFDFDEKFVIQQIKRNKYKNIFMNTLKTCLCACALLFVLVNTNTDYVKATKDIPILNKINEFFSLNKNMLVAIENDYIQELNIVKEQGDIKVNVDYMVVDEKNIYLFYQVTEKNNQEYQVSIELNKEGYSSSWGIEETEKYDILQYYFHHLEEDFYLDTFDFVVEYNEDKIVIPITIDQDKIAKPKTYEVNQMLKIENQELTISKVVVYPLSMEIHTTQNKDNTYIIENVEFELMVNGKVRDKEDGIQAVGFDKENGNYDKNYFMPSTYFLGDNFSISIKSAELIKKPGLAIYDLETNTFDDPTNTFKEITLYTKDTLTNPNPSQQSFENYNYYFELKVKDNIVVEEGKSVVAHAWLGTYSSYENDDGETIYQFFINGKPENNKFAFTPTVGEKVEINTKVKLK